MINLEWKLKLYTISDLTYKILMFLLPPLLFPMIAYNMTKGLKIPPLFIVFLLTTVFCSNFFSIILSYVLGSSIIPNLDLYTSDKVNEDFPTLYSLLEFNIYSLDFVFISILSLITGLVQLYLKSTTLNKFLKKYYVLANFFLEKIVTIFLPVYLVGALLKISHESDISHYLSIFGRVILIILLIQISYTTFLFFVLSRCKLRLFSSTIKNVVRPFIFGFISMSSLITLPTTLHAIKKNTKDSPIAELSASITVNFHDIGDCIALSFVSLVVFYISNGCMPSCKIYLLFAFLAAMTQFSAASIPGGTIMVLMPLLLQYLGLSKESAGVVLAVSILLEPLGTSINISGNIFLAMLSDKMFTRSSKQHNKLGIAKQI